MVLLAAVMTSICVAVSEPGVLNDLDPVPVSNSPLNQTTKRYLAAKDKPTILDLGKVRYLGPRASAALWLGLDIGGVYLPQQLKFANRDLLLAQISPSWAVGLAPWLSLGGSHSWVGLQSGRVRMLFVHHMLELMGQPAYRRLSSRSMRDRMAIGIESHRLDHIFESGIKHYPGGVRDLLLRFEYGMYHYLANHWRLSWALQFRGGWVYESTQRQLRPSIRLYYVFNERHELWLDAVGFFVHRDAKQRGVAMPRLSMHGQGFLTYNWQSKSGVGIAAILRYTTGFLSGEAPVYEAQPESLKANFVEINVGVRWGLGWRKPRVGTS